MLARVLLLLLILMAAPGAPMPLGCLPQIPEESASCALAVGNPSNSPSLNRDLDRLIARIVPAFSNPKAQPEAFAYVAHGLDKILTRLRKELDSSALFQQTTAWSIAGLSSSSALRWGCACSKLRSAETTQVTPSDRFRFTTVFLRTGARSRAYWKVGALLMAIAPVADLGRNDLRLLSALFHSMPTENIATSARLAFQIVNRIPAEYFLVEGSGYDLLPLFYRSVLIRMIPAHHKADANAAPDVLAHPGPVVSCAAARDILQILLLRCPRSKVEAITIRAWSKLRPRPWAQLFLHGALRVFQDGARRLQLIYGPEHTPHLLCELAVRAYRPAHLLLLTMLTGRFTVSTMEYVPLSPQEPALHALAAELTAWFRAERSRAVVLLLAHLDHACRAETVRDLLVMDANERDSWQSVEEGFWGHFSRLRFYGELHFHLMGCRELRSVYIDLGIDDIVRVLLAVAAWNECDGPIPSEKVQRDQSPLCRMVSMEKNIGGMIANLLMGVRSTDLSTASESDTVRFSLIQDLIARSWVAVAEVKRIVMHVFETPPFPDPEIWVNALDDAGDRVAFLTFTLFCHVLARWDPSTRPNELDQWRNALALRVDDLDADQLKQLHGWGSSFFEDWPGSEGTPRNHQSED